MSYDTKTSQEFLIFLVMGPVQSFKSSYDANISKRKKPKRKPFGASHNSTVSGVIPEKELTPYLQAELISEINRQKANSKKRLVIAYAILALALILLVLNYLV